ncbi:hypothetical protein [Mammaliicoccus vitulinus]|uniref:hypothetical protein n=1 Tax=Mammaliicoccus vitulinus TaxID=71237 RepID=UPI003F955117
MTVKLQGLKELETQLERKLGRKKTNKIIDQSLIVGGNAFIGKLKRDMATFKDTGATVDEIKLSKPEWVGGVRTVKVHWRGPKGRYRIIHLNEFGHYDRSGKWVNPKGKGAIDNALREFQDTYTRTVKMLLQKELMK